MLWVVLGEICVSMDVGTETGFCFSVMCVWTLLPLLFLLACVKENFTSLQAPDWQSMLILF
jgi:hypothetical protein